MEVFMQMRTVCVLRQADAVYARTMMLACTSVDVVFVGETESVDVLRTLIRNTQPDLVVYDPTIDEGELLVLWQSAIGTMPILMCWTPEPTYAVLAFEAGAVHYLIDRCSHADVELALVRCSRRLARYTHQMQLRENGLEAQYQCNVVSLPVTTGSSGHDARCCHCRYRCNVVSLPVTTGLEVRQSDNIVYVKGEGNYSRVVFQAAPDLVLSRTVGDMERVLQHSGFIRIHRSSLVNLNHVRRFVRGKVSRVQMSNGDDVDVSDSYREHLIAELNVVRRR